MHAPGRTSLPPVSARFIPADWGSRRVPKGDNAILLFPAALDWGPFSFGHHDHEGAIGPDLKVELVKPRDPATNWGFGCLGDSRKESRQQPAANGRLRNFDNWA